MSHASTNREGRSAVPELRAAEEGNFDAFVMAKGIKADDIEALLSGNLKLDEAPTTSRSDGMP